MRKFLTCSIYLSQQDILLIRRVASEKGYGRRGFSAAVRMILREWAAQHGLDEHPTALRRRFTPHSNTPGAS